MSLPARILRLKCDVAALRGPIDANSGDNPIIWKGNDVDIQIGIFAGAALATPSNVASITVVIKSSRDAADALVSATIDAADINPVLTLEQWNAGTHAHATVSLTGAQTELSRGSTGQPSETFWIAIVALTDSAPAREVTLAAGNFVIYEDGYQSGAPVSPELYYTRLESDARYVRRTAPDATFRISADHTLLELYNPDTALWHALGASGAGGAVQLILDQTGAV